MKRIVRITNWLKSTGYYRYLLIKFLKHYVYPLSIRQEQVAYNPRKFFGSWYSSLSESGFSDRGAISPRTSLLDSTFHYNSVENSLITWFRNWNRPEHFRVLDIGSGAGHWIDFYLNVLEASHVTCVEIAAPATDALQKKYSGDDRVTIRHSDVSHEDFRSMEVEVVNAIGVMFHIVEDALWERALRNFAQILSDGGVMVVGRQFGWITQNVQFHYTDDYEEWNPQDASGQAKVSLVNKRIRSLRRWKQAARRSGLQVTRVLKTPGRRGILRPENNVLVLTKES